MNRSTELSARQLRCKCDPSVFDFGDTSQLEPLDEVIGQKRAVEAITFGLNMTSPGYNVFVTGIEGTGKTTIVRDIVTRHARSLEIPSDWCMINNFDDEYRPRAITVPPAGANRFAKAMERLVAELKNRLRRHFENKEYQEKRSETGDRFEQQKREIFEKLNEAARQKGLLIDRTPSGYQTVPLAGDQPMPQEDFQALPKERRDAIEAAAGEVKSAIENALVEARRISQAQQKALEELMQQVARFVTRDHLQLMRQEYSECRDILAFLDEVENHVVENVEAFVTSGEKGVKGKEKSLEPSRPAFDPYKINVLVDRHDQQGAPVVFEPNPTYANLFGRIDKKAFLGTMLTDFTMVQAGSLLQANGGYLIMEIESVLTNPYVWQALKRALQNKQLSIEDQAAGMGYGTASLRPEAIPLEVKVILLGDYETFQVLQNHDGKFNKIFKVRADFDHETVRNDTTVQQYARFVSRVCREEKLLPFSAGGVAAIVEYGEKSIADQRKLSLRFGQIVGIIKEADYWARRQDAARVEEAHVVRAFNEHRFRYNLYEEKIHESYADDTIMIDVDGDVVGQVNALAVYQMGDISFGRPSRITAETYMGKHGIINIEREAKLSGKTHDKGVLILSGYLGRTFAQRYPLSLAISITFEQSYGGIDGDSASSTELYAIVSSLAEVPIHQGLAVTGSVNQKGEVQAIGGVNQKVEGFFDVCRTKGLTGRQGVIIPKANVKNLMLKREVGEAVEAGRFHIYAVASIEEGIEILTRKTAGRPDAEGNYPAESVYGRVQSKLARYLEQSLRLKKQFDAPGGDDSVP